MFWSTVTYLYTSVLVRKITPPGFETFFTSGSATHSTRVFQAYSCSICWVPSNFLTGNSFPASMNRKSTFEVISPLCINAWSICGWYSLLVLRTQDVNQKVVPSPQLGTKIASSWSANQIVRARWKTRNGVSGAFSTFCGKSPRTSQPFFALIFNAAFC